MLWQHDRATGTPLVERASRAIGADLVVCNSQWTAETAAENRARLKVRLYRAAVLIPLVFALLAFGYSDQAPALLREVTIGLDRLLGYPIMALIAWLGSQMGDRGAPRLRRGAPNVGGSGGAISGPPSRIA